MKVKISDLYDVGSSKRVFQSEWKDYGIPFYRAREIAKLSTDGFVDNELFIDEELYETYIAKYGKPQAGDIMVTGVGTLGVCYIVRENDRFYFKDGNILWFKQKAPDRILPQYLVKSFDSKDIKEFISKNSSGTTVGTFTIQTANKMEIELPSIEEQRKIISKISLVEEIIKNRKKELQKLDELVKARFVEMFGDPVSNPKGWKKEKAEKHIDLLSGYPFQSEQYVDEGINICGGLIIMPQKIRWQECKYWPSVDGFEDYLLAENDIVMALDRPWISEGFKIAQVDSAHLPALLIQRTARIRGIDLNQQYLFHCFINGGFDKHSKVTGSLVPHISAKDIRSFEIMIPPIDIQNQFGEFVKQLDKSKVAVQAALDKAQTLFDSLMQEYFG